jgi:hypothetical protein
MSCRKPAIVAVPVRKASADVWLTAAGTRGRIRWADRPPNTHGTLTRERGCCASPPAGRAFIPGAAAPPPRDDAAVLLCAGDARLRPSMVGWRLVWVRSAVLRHWCLMPAAWMRTRCLCTRLAPSTPHTHTHTPEHVFARTSEVSSCAAATSECCGSQMCMLRLWHLLQVSCACHDAHGRRRVRCDEKVTSRAEMR